MKEKLSPPQDHVFWDLDKKAPQQLTHTIKTDVVVVGGGMAGLSAVQSFCDKGYSVVLLEKSYCGAGATGKSSGFITPDSELNLSHLIRLFGESNAKKLWDFVCGGVSLIENNITINSLNCDYQVQDSFVVANSVRAFAKIREEYEARESLGYESSLYDKKQILQFVTSNDYFGALRYSNTFGINAYRYCQGMKKVLEDRGVKIFEETPVIKVHAQGVDTLNATVNADHIIVCTDRFTPELGKLERDVFQAQTFLMVSAPLSDDDIKKIFPDKQLMVWDTDLIYHYYRLIEGNRFLIGGSDLFSIFWGQEQHNSRKMFNKLSGYAHKKFPGVPFNFEYMWPGLIGISKDVMPLAGTNASEPNVYYISGAEGLPWAAALGRYSAGKIIDKRNDLDAFFALDRKFSVGRCLQSVLGKRIAFALSNLKVLYS